MDALTSADILVILQAVESLVVQSAELVAPDSPTAGSPALSLSTVVQSLTGCTNVDGHPPGCTSD